MTTYGTWLRGDARGWVDDGVILPPSPAIEANDKKRMIHPPFQFDEAQLHAVGAMIGRSLIERMELTLLALTVQTWHVHLVIAATEYDVGAVVKCAKDAVRYGLRPGRPIWTDKYDKRWCFDVATVERRVRYVENHNVAQGRGPRPWEFLTAPDEWQSAPGQ